MDKEFIKNPVIAYEKLQQENAELKAENERLKEELEIKSLTDNTTGETNYRSNLVNKYRTTLQEIKAIVKNICNGCTSECDCDEDCNYFLITEALTKAEVQNG